MPLPKQLRPTSSKQVGKKDRRVLANRYRIEKRLGSGNYGTAFVVTDLKCKDEKEKLKVLKEISVADLQPDETVDAMHEASLSRNLDHPGIVKFFDSFVDGDFFCIVTEFCEGGDLDMKMAEYRKTRKTIPEPQVVEWVIQLLLAVQYMHDRKILHRDLKARNIFLKNNVIKVGDFGISRILMGTTDMASTFVGTPYYMSPEVLKHEGYNSKSDVWSVGCILYELCTLEHAFEGQSLMGVMYKIVEGALPKWPGQYSKELNSVFQIILEKDPHQRPSASDVLKSAFIAKQMQLLKDSMMVKHKAKGQRELISQDYHQINQALKEQKRLEQLRKESDELKWKNMTPRERMRLRKQQKADEEAKRLQAAAIQQHLDNKMKYEEIKDVQNPYHRQNTFQLGEREQEQREKDEMVQAVFGHTQKSSPQYGEQYAVVVEEVDEEPEEEEEEDEADEEEKENENMQTLVERKTGPSLPNRQYLSQTVQYSSFEPKVQQQLLGGTVALDDRPITPMKNTMVYGVKYSSLDFKDGIPDKPDLAETYYSQFEDEFEPTPDDEGGELEETIVGQGAEDVEVEDLINCMQNALDKSDTIKSMTLTDSSATGAFGPKTRDIKIKNLREDAIKKMGKDSFETAYAFLKEARFGNLPNRDEGEIMQGLAHIVTNPNDCFLVDQLLFLEAQALLPA